MSEQMIIQLLSVAPQLGLWILFLVSLILLLREYRSFRGDVEKLIEANVNSKLGALIGDIQIKFQNAKDVLDKISSVHKQVEELSNDFETSIADKSKNFENTLSERTTHLATILSEVEQKLQVLQTSVLKGEDFTARDFSLLASEALC